MRWFEYKTEVDALHAPDELKDRLRAMKQNTANTTAPKRAAKPTLRFPGWKKLSGMAACFVAGAATVLVAGGGLLMGTFAMGGASAADNATAAGTMSSPQSSTLHSQESNKTEGGFTTGESYRDMDLYYGEYDAVTDTSDGNAAASPVMAPDTKNSAAQRGEETDSKLAPGRKVIYTASLTLETTQYDTTIAELHGALGAVGGYVQHSETMNYGTTSRRVQYVLRVPVEQYHNFLAATEGTGSLTEKTEDSQDITAQYVDVAARIETLQQQRDRLLQLSAQADNLTDLLAIEEKLYSVQYQLESYQRQLAIYDDQVDYCTVTVTVREVTVYTPVQPTAWERMQNALTRGFGSFVGTLFDLVLWVLHNLSWLTVLTVVVLTGRRVWKKRRTRRSE